MKPEEVLDLIGSPDLVGGDDTWQYDMDSKPAQTLSLKWNDRRVGSIEKKVPALWQKALVRDEELDYQHSVFVMEKGAQQVRNLLHEGCAGLLVGRLGLFVRILGLGFFGLGFLCLSLVAFGLVGLFSRLVAVGFVGLVGGHFVGGLAVSRLVRRAFGRK